MENLYLIWQSKSNTQLLRNNEFNGAKIPLNFQFRRKVRWQNIYGGYTDISLNKNRFRRNTQHWAVSTSRILTPAEFAVINLAYIFVMFLVIFGKFEHCWHDSKEFRRNTLNVSVFARKYEETVIFLLFSFRQYFPSIFRRNLRKTFEYFMERKFFAIIKCTKLCKWIACISNKSNKVQKEEPSSLSFARCFGATANMETLDFFASAFLTANQEKFAIYFRQTRRNKAKLTIIYVDKTFSLQNMRFQFALDGGGFRWIF